MNYQQTINWMFSQLPMFQRQGASAYKNNLDNTLALDKLTGHPHQRFKSIHVAGTNGKGSTSHMLASILQEAGYRVGLYTSPHLKDFRERIKINGECISETYVVNFIQEYKDHFEQIQPSFFEMTVSMAFSYFAQQNIDIAIIEVGLGGRLDSTNIITPEVSVITNIAFDHVALLGDTLPKIANEKAGIIKSNIPAVVGTTDTEYDFVFTQKSQEIGTSLLFADQIYQAKQLDNLNYDITKNNTSWLNNIECQLKGLYQSRNIPTVLSTIDILNDRGFLIELKHITSGLAHVIDNTTLLGRWQTLSTTPLTICDTGHNIHGITEVVKQINSTPHDQLHFVIAMVNDKDISGVLQLLPKKAIYYFSQAQIPRAMEAKQLQATAEKFGLKGESFETITLAYEAARHNSNSNDLIFIGGSTFTVAEVV